ncbi:MAG: tryptophan-rich sensory protein [Patescibacteria group bacterium]
MKDNLVIKLLVFVTCVLMIASNALANILPINNITTGGVSDSYPNLFAPAGITFSIWGLIYILLVIYTIYQFKKWGEKSNLFKRVGIYFSLSSVANILWIFSWHYHYIGLSVFLISFILILLIVINDIIKKEKLSSKEKLIIKTPFSIYFGWITVATIANITTYLVSVNWNGFGLQNYFWMIFVLIAGLLIGSIRMLKDRDVFYGLVLVWAYVGILIKHLSTSGFNGEYLNIIFTIVACLFAFAILEIFIISKKQIS